MEKRDSVNIISGVVVTLCRRLFGLPSLLVNLVLRVVFV
jgi:hypothetical protein